MKNNERENDVFDELLRDALASDAAPSEDFTARLMEQVQAYGKTADDMTILVTGIWKR